MHKSVAPAAQSPRWQQRFLSLLPQIEGQARFAFRHFKPEARDEAIQEVTANSLVAFVRLVDQGREAVASPTSLARFAVRQYFAGRRAGTSMNVNDVSSRCCRNRKRVRVERLHRFDDQSGEWRETVVEDHQTPVPDQAAFRCDFPEWLSTLPDRDRQIAETLATGERTSCTAKRFKVSPGRISQLRRELHDAWHQFHGELLPPATAPA